MISLKKRMVLYTLSLVFCALAVSPMVSLGDSLPPFPPDSPSSSTEGDSGNAEGMPPDEGKINPAPLDDAPPSSPGDPVFRASIYSTSPMTPEEIRKYRRYMDQKQRATFDRLPPKFDQVRDVVKLRPGMLPPVVRISAGYSGALYFTDITGSAWPIDEAKSSTDAFELEHPKTKSFNSLVLTSLRSYHSGDLIVFLKGLDVPIAVRIISDPRHTDIKTNIVVTRMGPHPILPDISGMESVAGGVVNNVDERFIADIPPKGAILIPDDSPNIVKAWSFGGSYYLRSHYTLTSPAYLSLTKGDGGINLYRIPKISVVIFAVDGKELSVPLGTEEDVAGE